MCFFNVLLDARLAESHSGHPRRTMALVLATHPSVAHREAMNRAATGSVRATSREKRHLVWLSVPRHGPGPSEPGFVAKTLSVPLVASISLPTVSRSTAVASAVAFCGHGPLYGASRRIKIGPDKKRTDYGAFEIQGE